MLGIPGFFSGPNTAPKISKFVYTILGYIACE